MDYHGTLPEHNDNISHDRPFREFMLLLVGMAVAGAAFFLLLGVLVDVTIDNLSEESEAKVNAALSFKWPLDKDIQPERQAMLQKLADELRPCAQLRQPVTVHFAEGEQANAAVFPGGHVIVFSGLLEKVKSKNGLAFVLAHELAHMKNRDHLRAMGRGIVLVTASSLLTGSHSDLTQVLVPVNEAGFARYSQGREREADLTALNVLQCRFGHVGGATEFFEAMKHDEGAPSAWRHAFSSHPELQARIDALQAMMRERQYVAGDVVPYE